MLAIHKAMLFGFVFSVNVCIQKNLAHLSILFFFSTLMYFVLCFCLLLSKTNFCIFSIFKFVSNNNKQIMKPSVESYTGFSCAQTYSRSLLDCFRNMALAFFKTFYICICVQDFISIYFTFCEVAENSESQLKSFFFCIIFSI